MNFVDAFLKVARVMKTSDGHDVVEATRIEGRRTRFRGRLCSERRPLGDGTTSFRRDLRPDPVRDKGLPRSPVAVPASRSQAPPRARIARRCEMVERNRADRGRTTNTLDRSGRATQQIVPRDGAWRRVSCHKLIPERGVGPVDLVTRHIREEILCSALPQPRFHPASGRARRPKNLSWNFRATSGMRALKH